MIIANNCRGKVVYVLGLGTSGHGALNTLLAAEAVVFAWDDNPASRIPIDGVTYVEFKNLNLQEIDLLVVSPGVAVFWPKPHPAVEYAYKHFIPVVCDVDLFMYNKPIDAPCVAVTGTNGKSTTVSLIEHVLNANKSKNQGKVALGGNIGTSALDLPVLNCDDSYILELSSYQLELMTGLNFEISVLLNITQDHMSRHNGMIGYANSKQKILQNVFYGGWGIISVDDPYCLQIMNMFDEKHKQRIIPISANFVPKSGIGWNGSNMIDDTKGSKVSVINIDEFSNLSGKHNLQNIAAAYTTCSLKGVQVNQFKSALKTFSSLKHRHEKIDCGVPFKIINDSKATNIDACVKGLEGLDKIYWIVGGLAKSSDFCSLKGQHLNKIKKAFVIGTSAEIICDFLKKNDVLFERCDVLDIAVNKAMADAYQEYQSSLSHDISVVLSPACASFDQFNNFEHRGEVFSDLIKVWCQEHGV